jgi:Ni2+-binding GTPase involved in maturation of urease and hydrogenase
VIPDALKVPAGDARRIRGDRPIVVTHRAAGQGLDTAIRFIETGGLHVWQEAWP